MSSRRIPSMTPRNVSLFVFLLLGLVSGSIYRVAASQDTAKSRDKAPHVLIQTDLGDIEIEVDTQHAPLTSENFLKYVDAGHYEGGRFHRAVKTNPDNQPDN